MICEEPIERTPEQYELDRFTHMIRKADELKGLRWGGLVTKNNINGKLKTRAVVCNETGERFESIVAAEQAKGLVAGSVCKSLHRNTRAGGFTWRYANPDEPRTKSMRDCPVLCVETGKVYARATEAERELRVSQGKIGVSIRKGIRCRGLHWAYLPKAKIGGAA